MLSLFKPRCPLNSSEKTWIEYRIGWLLDFLGTDRLKSFETILPTREFFPLPYSGKPDEVQTVFERVCRYMNMDPDQYRVHVFDDSTDPGSLPPMQKWLVWSRNVPFPFYEGFYCELAEAGDAAGENSPLATIHVHRDMVADLELIIALFSRELSQFLLLKHPDGPMEKTDFQHTMELLPLFYGLGIFGANAVMRERNEHSLGWEYWWMIPHGALPARYFGYALALLAWLRDEPLPPWRSHLRRDAEETLKASLRYLDKTGDTILVREPSSKAYDRRPVQVWLEDLEEGTPGRRVAALWAIQAEPQSVTNKSQVSLIAENLSHHDPFVRTASAQALDALGETAQEAVPQLIDALDDRSGAVRMVAALALGKMMGRGEEVIPALMPVLNDRNVHAANAAAWSLGRFGTEAEAAGPLLVRLLRRGILRCDESTLEDILDAILAVTDHPEEVVMDTLLERDSETCSRALDLLKERQIDADREKV